MAAPAPPIRLMIVDDSLVVRTVLTTILTAHAEFAIVAAVPDARQAIERLAKTAVDIILLDVEMPRLDGLSALPELLARAAGARVLMVSASTADGARATVRALTQGAADTLLKPATADFAGTFADVLVSRLLRLGRATSPRPDLPSDPARIAASAPAPAPARSGAPRTGMPACIAIGASTGGPHALARFLAALPSWVAAPILVTQHLPAAFMPHFAGQLALLSGRPAKVAESGDRLRDGAILLAPGNGHMRVIRDGLGLRVRIDDRPAASGCLPSVDPMLASLAGAAGAAVIAVVLSGMGRDGAIGARLLAAAGAEILVQDEASSVIWGMPGTIARAALATATLPPDAIARRIGERCRLPIGATWR